MSKKTTHPPTIADNEALVEIYGYIPKRILWEILWDAASRLCPVGQQSVVQAKTEPDAPGSLVDWILEEAKAREVWFPKSVAGADEKKPDAEQKQAEAEDDAEAEVVETV